LHGSPYKTRRASYSQPVGNRFVIHAKILHGDSFV
jgi:hypothetical protein